MSDPVSNAEIEDVLSSIRRLVSGESGAANSSGSTQETPEKPIPKLVLTADFRVPNPPEENPDNSAEHSEEHTPEGSESDCPDDTQETSNEPQEKTAEANILSEINAANEDQAPEIQAVYAAEDDYQEPAQEMSLVDKIADLEAAVGNQNGEWEPDGSSFQEDPDAEQILTEPVQPWIDSTVHELGPEQSDQAIQDAEIIYDDDQGADDQTSDDDSFEDADGVIDEETLRDMVSEIVRQELQGALGERITRNVRKLVRREINRTMAARDFD